MNYIRTKDNEIIDLKYFQIDLETNYYIKGDIKIKLSDAIKGSDKIEDLCDEFIIKYIGEEKPNIIKLNLLIEACEKAGVSLKEHLSWLLDFFKRRIEYCYLGIDVNGIVKYIAEPDKEGNIKLL